MKKAAAFLLFLFILLGTVWGFSSAIDNPFSARENVEIRREMESVILGSLSAVVNTPFRVFPQQEEYHRVKFQTRESEHAFYILFTNERAFTFPLYSSGSYIIKRSKESGEFLQIKIFLKNDPGSFLRIFPHGSRSSMDIWLYNTRVQKGVIVPMEIEELAVTPLALLIERTKEAVRWDLIFPVVQYSLYDPVTEMVEKIRDSMEFLQDADDGAMDAEGNWILIENSSSQEGGFNCSGFVKWVIDGLYLPRNGTLLPIELLKVKQLDIRGNEWTDRYEDERDPWFGLDWTRNLAAIIRGTPEDPERMDVRNLPFLRYVEDEGYRIEELPLALYLLAVQSPGSFYLASVSQDFGTDPVLHQHTHVLALFPTLSRDGDLRIAVMERNLQASLDSLLSRYPKEYIHLVRVEGDPLFRLPTLP